MYGQEGYSNRMVVAYPGDIGEDGVWMSKVSTYGVLVAVIVGKPHVNRKSHGSEYTVQEVNTDSFAVVTKRLTGPRTGTLRLGPCQPPQGFSSAR